MDELRCAQGEVAVVKVTDDTVDALLAIRDACRGEGITQDCRGRPDEAAMAVEALMNELRPDETADVLRRSIRDKRPGNSWRGWRS